VFESHKEVAISDPAGDVAADVVVVGGGPAGSTAAALLADAGFEVVLLERERFPRFRIGESLIPAATNVLLQTRALPKVESAGFVHKYGIHWVGTGGRHSSTVLFGEAFSANRQLYSYQVLRSRFDSILLEHAKELGVRVLEGVEVRRVLFRGDEAYGVEAVVPDGAPMLIRARVVIDASGRSTVLASQRGAKRRDPRLRNFAVYAHFRGATREPGIEGGLLRVFYESKDHWSWYIPLADDVTSVGVVAKSHVLRDRDRDAEAYFLDSLAGNPALAERMTSAVRLSALATVPDCAYQTESCAGSGWVSVGDAAGFVDPIFSSGVSIAMQTASFAADAIERAFRKGDFSAASFGSFVVRAQSGVARLRDFTTLFYELGPYFLMFLQNPAFRYRILTYLVGDVFRDADPGLLIQMRTAADQLRPRA